MTLRCQFLLLEPWHRSTEVTGRPFSILAPFEFSFQEVPKLRLHKLPQTDIAIYVEDKFAKHARIRELSDESAKGTQLLVDEIVESASGVFLWVKLVVRSLLQGFQNYDRLLDLQARLRKLPRDQEELFSHMLRTIPEEYKMEAFRTIEIVQTSNEPLSALTLRLAEGENEDMLNAEVSLLSESDKRKYIEEVEGRLRSRCVGLLEVNFHYRPGMFDTYIFSQLPLPG
jgi:hypothetical protein